MRTFPCERYTVCRGIPPFAHFVLYFLYRVVPGKIITIGVLLLRFPGNFKPPHSWLHLQCLEVPQVPGYPGLAGVPGGYPRYNVPGSVHCNEQRFSHFLASHV